MVAHEFRAGSGSGGAEKVARSPARRNTPIREALPQNVVLAR